MKLRPVKTKYINNVWDVEGISVNGERQAAKAGFKAGAEAMAEMVREKVEANDLRGLVELLAATKTNSFYGA